MNSFSYLDNHHSKECRFCSFLHDETENEAVNIPWWRGSDYAALVSVGALVPGWTLVCPIEHDLNLSTHYSKRAFWESCTEVEAIVRKRYGSVRIFEHGPQSELSSTGCGTGHAHLHLVPLQFPLIVEALRWDQSLSWMPCRASDIHMASNGSEYLFVADEYRAEETRGLLCKLDVPQSQFFRRVIAQRLGMGEFYNYRHYPMRDIAWETWNDLRATYLDTTIEK